MRIHVLAHDYDIYEVNYGGINRGVRIIVNGVQRNNSVRYRLGNAYNPHHLDSNWYLQNYNVFYLELGRSIAQRMENTVQNWQNPRWINATHARIHGHGYHAIREDLF